ncbi:MAG: hypothetical protein L0K44_05895, partial [Yaniella sp.]|nr:hypothetical protein [Yaniella sp.]
MPTNTANMKIGDRVVVYNNAGHPRLDGVPTYAEAIDGVGFTGYRWISAADRLKDLPQDWYPAIMQVKQVEILSQQAPLVVLDVDSTLIHEEVIELLAA